MPFLTKTDVEWFLPVKWKATGMIFFNSKHQPEFDPVRSRKNITYTINIIRLASEAKERSGYHLNVLKNRKIQQFCGLGA